MVKTITELIDRLVKIRAQRGDVVVKIWDDWGASDIDRISVYQDDDDERAIVIQSAEGSGWSNKDDA